MQNICVFFCKYTLYYQIINLFTQIFSVSVFVFTYGFYNRPNSHAS